MPKDTIKIEIEVSSEVVRWATGDHNGTPNPLRMSLESELGKQAVDVAVKRLEQEDEENIKDVS